MAKQKVIIRVDGNSNIGLGHIYRGIALAEMLKDDFDISFITKPDSIITPITDVGFNYIFLQEPAFLDEPEWLKQNIDNETIIICDGYEFKSEYQKRIKKQGFILVYVDDLAEYRMYADLVINHNPGIKQEDYKAEPYTKFALGLDYVLLRPAFLNAAKGKRKIGKINTAFVCFGGSDFHDLTLKASNALLQVREIKKINIVIGSAYKHKELFRLSQLHNHLKIYKNLSEKDLLDLMNQSDIAIAPSSTILFELCSVKSLIISGYYTENQKEIYEEFNRRGLIKGIGDYTKIKIKELIKTTEQFLKEDTNKYLDNQLKLFDGGIKNRFIDTFKNINLNLRKSTEDDVRLLFEWVNDPAVRKNAINQKKIEYKNHLNWYKKILLNSDSSIYIFLKGEIPIGQIRFDFDKELDSYIIDYSIDIKFRGNKLGEKLIELGIAKLDKEKACKNNIIARVRKTNIASNKIFIKLGFELEEQNKTILTYLRK